MLDEFVLVHCIYGVTDEVPVRSCHRHARVNLPLWHFLDLGEIYFLFLLVRLFPPPSIGGAPPGESQLHLRAVGAILVAA